MTYQENDVEGLDSVSLTSIINISIVSGGSGWVSRIWQSQYDTPDMSQYNIMWCYMLSALTNDIIKKNNSRHCHIDFIALKEIIKEGGLTHKWHSLYGWLGARNTCSSALAMGLRLSCINPSISSLAGVWWVITRRYGSTLHYYVRTLYWSTWLIEDTHWQGSVQVCAQPMRDVVTM